MVEVGFFEESKEQSRIKTAIVAKYFDTWAKIILHAAKKTKNNIAYIDLFAGPGIYDDGTKSTPILILEKAIQNPNMREMLVTIFNDANRGFAQSLQAAIDGLHDIKTLKYKPSVYNDEVGEEMVQIFEDMHLVPSFTFIDPWGYKGLSRRLINSVLKDWGCDCVLFFNYNRINMGVTNPRVKEHIDAIFGQDRADRLRNAISDLNPMERELVIVEAFSESIKEMGFIYVLPFTFKDEGRRRTSHHLIFISKHFKGYEIMKEIMAKESSSISKGVASFEYNPATINQPLLFELNMPLDDLEALMLAQFAGQTLSVQYIYENHSVGKRFIKANYKDVLIKLESLGKVTIDPPFTMRRKRKGAVTLPDNAMITFPVKK